jgi:hypothetical protein
MACIALVYIMATDDCPPLDWADQLALDLFLAAQLHPGNTIKDACRALAVALRNAHAKGYAEGYIERGREASHFHGVKLSDLTRWREEEERRHQRVSVLTNMLQDAESAKVTE